MRGADFAADWLPTVIEGIFGLELDHGDESSGAPVRALDGKNLCECDDGPRKCSPCTHGAPLGRRGEDKCCLLTCTGRLFCAGPAICSGGASPRSEVISQVSNDYWNTSIEGKGGVAIRVGDMKLLVGYPGDPRHLRVRPLSTTPVAFGLSGGFIENGTTDHAVSTGWAKPSKANQTLCGGAGIDPYEPLRSGGFCLYNVSADPTESAFVDHGLSTRYSYLQ
eukprot:SAG25_NODE_142_length_14075_cov_38.666070_17_plen_222_part_00